MKKRAIDHARDAAGLVVNPVEYRNNQMRRANAIEMAALQVVREYHEDDLSSDAVAHLAQMINSWPGEFDTSETIRELTRRMKISLAAKKAETRR